MVGKQGCGGTAEGGAKGHVKRKVTAETVACQDEKMVKLVQESAQLREEMSIMANAARRTMAYEHEVFTQSIFTKTGDSAIDKFKIMIAKG